MAPGRERRRRAYLQRAIQLDQLAANTAGIYDDLEALMGSAPPTVDVLELPEPTSLEIAAFPAA